MSIREDLRIGLVTDPSLVKVFKAKYGPKFFDEYSLNSMIVKRDKNDYSSYNFEDNSEDMVFWINKYSLKKTGEDFNKDT